ncbi:MAG TPA: PAS domain S-box protein [Stellaceae bacterium]|jgi:PAS domain S-box-containing protein|nr:PAS domain S-box protein [Stellaceae bacterium]
MSENELHINERQFRQFIEGVRDYAIIMLDPTGRIISWNAGAERLKGYREAEILGQSMERLYPPETVAAGTPARLLAKAAAEGRCEDEGWRTRKDGTRFFANVVVTALRDEAGELIGFAKVTRDITERREAERRLQAHSERAEALLEAVPDAVVIVDHNGRIITVNAQTEAVFRYSRAELIGQPVEILIPERLQAAHIAERTAYHRAPAVRQMGAGRDLLARRSNGGEFPVDVSLSLLATPEGNLIISTIRDGTQRKAAELALRASEEQLKRAENIARIGSAWWEIGSGTINWSDGLYRVYGLSRDTFSPSQHSLAPLIHPDDRDQFMRDRELTGHGLCPPPSDYRIIRPDGTLRRLYREFAPVLDGTDIPCAYIASVQDVTERRQTEEQLRQAQKMEAIGNLTGGMAHDFNNLLGIVIANLDLLRELKGEDADVDELSQEALGAAIRGAELTRRLLAFARQQPLQPRRVDVNELVGGITKLLGRTVGEDVEISLDLATDVWPTVVDPAQLESSLVNLANNSRDAMPSGGRLFVKTANSHLDADYAALYHDVAPGDYVEIQVHDTGTGMSAEIMGRIFEPFYTTKEQGKGTGLGLSMVFGFMKQSGGHINVYSELGLGTTFRLYLPRLAQEEVWYSESILVEEALGGTESILIVEDNTGLRRVAVRQIGGLGYRVIEAEDANVALELLERENVDLMLTDIVMPGGIDGIQLARQACTRLR